MKTILIILTFVSSKLYSQNLKSYFQKKDSSIKAVQVYNCKSDKSLLAIIFVWEPDWWEGLSVVKVSGTKVLWEAKFDSLPGEQSIRSIRQINLKGFSNLFFEVYGQTHMGNGFYYLYMLNNKKMALIATTRAVDRNLDGGFSLKNDLRFYSDIFKNDTLTAHYNDSNGDRISDIQLTGTIQILNDESKIVKQFPARKVLVYNKPKGKYVEDKSKRVGFDSREE